ncbi:POC1 centriolar protein A [Nowakowskiella sp. JEL0407]|nr:POC1 centriolar protein A [Nowakowskiella sp. JEL0407]
MLWNFKPQLRAFRFVGHASEVTGVDFNNAGNCLASCSKDKTVRLWSPTVKGDVTVLKAHTSSIRSVQFSADAENLITSSDDKTIKLWSTYRTKFLCTFSGHLNWVRTAKFSPDSRLIVSGSDDKTIKLWDTKSKNCVKTYWDHSGIITSISFHPSGTLIASGSTDKSIKVFDIRTHKLLQHYENAHCPKPGSQRIHGSIVESGGGGVNSVAFGGDNGEFLISSGVDAVAKIWDLTEGHLFYTLHGHSNGPTTSAIFSPNADFFATGGSDAIVMVWKSNFTEILKEIRTEVKSTESFEKVEKRSGGGEKRSLVFEDKGGRKGKSNVAWSPENPEIVDIGSPIFSKLSTESVTVSPTKKAALSIPPQPPAQAQIPTESVPKTASYEQKPTQSSIHTSPNVQEIHEPKTRKLQVQEIPVHLSNTIKQIVEQVDMLTQTMSILETRLSLNEDKVSELGSRIQDRFNRLEEKLGI